MLFFIALMLVIGVVAILSVGSAWLVGQALLESQGCPDLDDELTAPVSGKWQAAAMKAAAH